MSERHSRGKWEDDAGSIPRFCPFCRVSLVGIDPYAHSFVHGPEHIQPVPQHARAIEMRRQLIEDGGVTAEELE